MEDIPSSYLSCTSTSSSSMFKIVSCHVSLSNSPSHFPRSPTSVNIPLVELSSPCLGNVFVQLRRIFHYMQRAALPFACHPSCFIEANWAFSPMAGMPTFWDVPVSFRKVPFSTNSPIASCIRNRHNQINLPHEKWLTNICSTTTAQWASPAPQP